MISEEQVLKNQADLQKKITELFALVNHIADQQNINLSNAAATYQSQPEQISGLITRITALEAK